MNGVLGVIRRQRRRKRRTPTRRSGWALALGLGATLTLLAGVGWLLAALITGPWLTVRWITVRASQRLTAADFERALSAQRGRPLLLVDVDHLRSELEQAPGVHQARVARRLPDTLDVLIVERRAVARTFQGGRLTLVDEEGLLFRPVKPLPGDEALPELRGLSTPPGERRLWAVDRVGVESLLALERVLGARPPEGVVVDLTPRDRVVLRPGRNAPALWLDRAQPERNLQHALDWRGRVAEITAEDVVDLRFPHRLTLAPRPSSADAAVE